ncbi:squalene--hopene cyclase [Ktedonosporobacter rubrisoli]|uniref:Squalene--hopene cyclase n=1 Tax=Ktedonosporobacter rubrisoli TaxID=2509675 RepID=A0A4P6JRH5_KTERU|nr:squalene--hopene cyclase [Ktedonosporobacter rubrisoli]QBD77416.1 squalene--hopene cyclase [Ktedonosporobacter rubrisoli]
MGAKRLNRREKSWQKRAVDQAVEWLLEHQDADGWWCGELETNVTMTAEHVLLLRFLELSVERIREGAIRHILSKQRVDGSWALYFGGPADLSTTIEAYVALKVLGVDTSCDMMQRALKVIHQQGGIAKARVFTKIWLALFGQYPWSGIPSMPPELIYLSPRLPLNLYDFACWARGTIAPLLIVLSHKPTKALGCSVAELIVPGSENHLDRVPGSGPFWWLDKLLKLYEAFAWQPGRLRARQNIVDWIVERQEADGSWGGIQPPWVYSLIALHIEGMGLDHPVMQRGIEGQENFVLDDEGGWRFQACMSPVWDTAWGLRALRYAGLRRDHPSLRRAVQWLLREQIFSGGDWQVRCGPIACGGWAFEFENDIYPDIDDTGVVVLALLEAGEREEVCKATESAARWVVATQSSNGGWGAFDKDNMRGMVYRLPFADFGALLDPPSEDVTAHVLEMLAQLDDMDARRHIQAGLQYLRSTQRLDGSWFGRWGVNYIYGTWCVISALVELRKRGYKVQDMIDRGVVWLVGHQNDDGGWGETCYSYEDSTFAGIGSSTPSQTAWATLALQLAGLDHHSACTRGLEYLCQTQVSGTWEEREYTGTGFPHDFYIKYHLYQHVFPTMALARGCQAQQG